MHWPGGNIPTVPSAWWRPLANDIDTDMKNDDRFFERQRRPLGDDQVELTATRLDDRTPDPVAASAAQTATGSRTGAKAKASIADRVSCRGHWDATQSTVH